MIIEGILTTENEDGHLHVAPLGPWVNDQLTEWTLKPFQTSNTFRNLHRTGRAVFHVIDNSLLMAQAVLGKANHWEAMHHPDFGYTLKESCHWYALRIVEWDLSQPRAVAKTELVHQEVIRPFWGWNRAKHAIVEAAILTSRVSMIEPKVLLDDFARLKIIVEKTAGPVEAEAFTLLETFVADQLAEKGYVGNT